MEHTLLYNFIQMFFLSCSYFLYAKGSTHMCIHSYEKGELHVDCSYRFYLILSNLPQLPSNTFSLNLQYNRIVAIEDNQFENMTNLTVLDLSFNILIHISKQAFNRLEKLQQLRLNDNNLVYDTQSFPIGSFQPLKSLKLLSIENNNAMSTSIFPDKTIAHLTKLGILKMDLHVPLSEKYSIKDFGKEYCKLSYLYSLHLNIKSTFFTITQLNNNFFQYTPNLTQLHILLFTPIIFDTFTLSTLDKLKLLQIDYGYEEIYKTVMDWRIDMAYILSIHFSNLELISKVSNSSTEILILKNVRNDFPKGNFLGFCGQNLLDEYLINTSIRQLHLTNIFGLNQKCPTTQTVINETQSLKLLNLTMNNLTWISLNLPSVVTLDLNHNRLRNYLVNNSYLKTQTSKLENISLSHNQIYKLNTEIFKGQPYLKHIDLSFNNISNISFDLSHLEELQVLNLANNEIKILTKKSMKEIDRLLQKNNDTKIDLSNNPFQCTCNTFSFLQWMRQIRHHFIRFSKYQCISGHVPISKANIFNKAILYLEQECFKLKPKTKNTTNLTLSVSLTVFGIITAMLLSSAVVIYKQRWKLRYMYYTARMKYLSKENESEDSSEYNYDAFISYSDEDRMFVIDHCIKNLEEDRNLKLCIHERDFIPGHDINNNMVTAIQTSRKTICIITRSFLESDFCMFELNMARMESTHSRNGKNILFLVFYEKLSSKDLPLVLCEHIQKQSYIQYPSNEIANAIFWDKISDAINA